MKNKVITIISLLLLSFNLFSQLPQFDWAHGIGGTESDLGYSITTDNYGNILVTGYFVDSTDFNPGIQENFLVSNGLADIFVLKLDSLGNYIWAISFGGGMQDYANDIKIDTNGDIYITGNFNDTVDFNPGIGVFELTSNGNEDAFILKLNSQGEYIWAKSFGANYYDHGNSLAFDNYSNVYITGVYNNTVDFNPGTGVFNINSNGNGDIFIVKLDSLGNFIWAISMGGTDSDGASSIVVDNNGDILSTGSYRGTADFNPGSSTNNLYSSGTADVFISKLSSNGDFIWAKKVGGSYYDYGKSISVDSNNNILISGLFGNTVDFNPGSGTYQKSTNGGHDIFILKLTSYGSFDWVKTFGGTESDYSKSFAIDTYNNIYVAGYYKETCDFDPGSSTHEITSNGYKDIFILKLNNLGNFEWVNTIGGSNNDIVESIAIDNNLNVITTGYFYSIVDFNPGLGINEISSNGSSDLFIHKVNQTNNPIAEFSITDNAIIIGETVQFIDESLNSPTNWFWDFGDGATSTLQNPSHAYQTTGDYHITLIVSNSIGSDTLYINNYVSILKDPASFDWAFKMGGSSYENGESITTDADGYIYSTGIFEGTVDFDPGFVVLNLASNGGADLFVTKHDSLGNLIWAINIGAEGHDYGKEIVVDTTGYIYITGSFKNTVDFDPGSAVVSLTSNGYSDVFLLKLDTAGNFNWVKSWGSSQNNDYGYSLALNSGGDIFVTGYFGGTTDFDPGTNILNLTSNGYQDIYVSKFTSSGNFEWTKSFGGNSYDKAYSITVDNNENIIITGSFRSTITFDPVLGINDLVSNGDDDIFILKMDTLGTLIWAKGIGGNDYDIGEDIAVDLTGNIFVTGKFEELVDFDPDTSIHNIGSNGFEDLFLLKLDENGSFNWVKSAGGSNSSTKGWSLFVKENGNIFVIGEFWNSIDIVTGPGVFNITSNGFNDILILKYNNLGEIIWGMGVGGPSSDIGYSITTDASENIIATGSFKATVDFNSGIGEYNLTAVNSDIFVTKFYEPEHPIAFFTASDTIIEVGEVVEFTDESMYYPVSWDWDFGDGATSNIQNPSHIYLTPGYYTVTLIVSDGVVNDTLVKTELVTVFGEAPPFSWARSVEGTHVGTGTAIALDPSGNVYYTGYFIETADFDPGVGITNLTSNGSYDIFISKFNSSGDFIWAKSIGSTLYDKAHSILVDDYNNVYITGDYQGTVDFDPGSGIHNRTAVGYNDIYILKLDTSGNFLSVISIGGNNSDIGYALAFDVYGNIIVTGAYRGTVDFDPGSSVFPLISNGDSDVFIAKYDGLGNFIWAKSIGGSDYEIPYSIVIDDMGNILITGKFEYIVDFDPGTPIYNLTTNGNYDIFIAKYSSSGSFIWAKGMGDSSSDSGNSLAVDIAGNVYTTGYFYGTVDFNPGLDTYELSSNGYYDIFISKLDASGSFLWARNMGGTSYDYGNSVAVDINSNVYVTGNYSGTSDFLSGPGIYSHTSNGDKEIFLSKLNSSGDLIWVESIGGNDEDVGNAIVLDDYNNIYYTGHYDDLVDFDPGVGVNYLLSNNGYDIFISKLSPPIPLEALFSASATEIIIGNLIQFADESTGGPISWIWDFGDGSTDTNQNPTHVYQSTGSYSVSLLITDGSDNDTQLIVNYITVSDPIIADFIASDTIVDMGESVFFADQSTGNPTNWMWNFGDGETSDLQNPGHIYQNYGTYYVSLIASNNLSSDTTIFYDYIVVNDTIPYPLSWLYEPTGSNHTILFGAGIQILIDNNNISSGDYIGVFYDDNGVLECGGYSAYSTDVFAITAWGDDNTVNDKVGFLSNESFQWKVWRVVDSLEIEMTATYNLIFPNQGEFFVNGMSAVLSMTGSAPSIIETQSIILPEAWSMFSTYMLPDFPDIADVLSPVLSNIVIVKDGFGLIYWPEFGVNLIGDQTPGYGYQIKMLANDTLIIEGSIIQPDTVTISLPFAWSILGYLRTSPAPVESLLVPVVSQLIIMKDWLGLSYWPQYNLNMIGDMNPGEGYQIKMNSAQTFTYPANSSTYLKTDLIIPQTQYYQCFKNTGVNMTLGLYCNNIVIGSEIGVFNQFGLLIGSGVIECDFVAISLWGDDELTLEIDGLVVGEEFEIRIWEPESHQERKLFVDKWIEGNNTYANNKIAIAGSFYLEDNDNFMLFQNTPNPFSHETEFSFYLPKDLKLNLRYLIC